MVDEITRQKLKNAAERLEPIVRRIERARPALGRDIRLDVNEFLQRPSIKTLVHVRMNLASQAARAEARADSTGDVDKYDELYDAAANGVANVLHELEEELS